MLSIIVPVHNSKRYLERCFKSLSGIVNKAYEIIIIDNGSTDGSWKVCDEYAADHENVKAIHHENRGVYSSRVEGVKAARGEFVAFLDSDDRIDSKGLLELYNLIRSDDAISISVGTALREYPDGKEMPIFKEGKARKLSPDEALEEMISDEFFFWQMWGKVFRRELFDDVVCDPEIISTEDLDIFRQIFKSGKVNKVAYEPVIAYHYYYNKGSMTAGKDMFAYRESDLKSYRKVLYDKDLHLSEKSRQDLSTRAIQVVYEMTRERCYRGVEDEELNSFLESAKLELGFADGNNFFVKRVNGFIDDGNARAYFDKCFESIIKGIETARIQGKDIYIYGTGIVARYVSEMMNGICNYKGYLISDDQPSLVTFYDKKVYHVSEVDISDKCIIPALNGKNQSIVGEELRKRNAEVISLDLPEVF